MNSASEWEKRAKDFESESLEDWLRDEFFDYHRKLYENRPIYFPLASAKKSFVAYVSIHRWTDSTLSALLAEHLIPERKAIEGALVDLQAERNSTDKKSPLERGEALHPAQEVARGARGVHRAGPAVRGEGPAAVGREDARSARSTRRTGWISTTA